MVRQKYLDSICLFAVALALVVSLLVLGGTPITGSAREPEPPAQSEEADREEPVSADAEAGSSSFPTAPYSRRAAPGPMGQPSSSHTASSRDHPARKPRLYGSMAAVMVPKPALWSYRRA